MLAGGAHHVRLLGEREREGRLSFMLGRLDGATWRGMPQKKYTITERSEMPVFKHMKEEIRSFRIRI
jgi:hypothetical protein